MKMLSIAALAATTLLSANAFAAKPTQYFASVEQVIESDSKVSRIERNLKKDGFIKQSCSSHIIYYISTPETTEYLAATADCTYYQPHEGIGFETTYATVKFDVLFSKDSSMFRAGNSIDVNYKTVY